MHTSFSPDELDLQILASIRDWVDFLRHRVGPKSSDLSGELGRSRPFMRYRLDNLEAAGLIIRHALSQPEYSVTDAGRRLAVVYVRAQPKSG